MLLYLLTERRNWFGKKKQKQMLCVMLDKKKIAYEALTYEVDTFIDGMHCAELTGAPWMLLTRRWSCREKANNTMCL